LLELLYAATEHMRAIRSEIDKAIRESDEFFSWLGPLQDDRETPHGKYDPSKIKWVQAQSASGKGPYERYPAVGAKAESTPDYNQLLADLKSHDGKLWRSGFFCMHALVVSVTADG